MQAEKEDKIEQTLDNQITEINNFLQNTKTLLRSVEHHYNRSNTLAIRHKLKKPESPVTVPNFDNVFFEDIVEEDKAAVEIFKPDDEIIEEEDEAYHPKSPDNRRS